MQALGLQLYLKETPTQLLEIECEYCEIFQNTYFEKHLRITVCDEMIFEARLFWAAVIDKLGTYFQSYFQAFNKIVFEKIFIGKLEKNI